MSLYPLNKVSSPVTSYSGNNVYTRTLFDYPVDGEDEVAVLYDVPNPVEVSYEDSFKHGWGIRGYHERKNNGELLPHTPYTQFVTRMKGPAVPFVWKKYDGPTGDPIMMIEQSNYHFNVRGAYDPKVLLGDLTALVPTEDLTRWRQGAAAKIYNNGFDLSTFIAESNDLRRTFTGLLSKVGSIKKQILKKTRNPKRLLRDLEDAWLEARYGWRPLMYDIEEFNETLREFDEKRTRWSERVGATERWTDTETISWSTEPYNWYIDRTNEYEISLRGSCTADIMLDKWRTDAAVTAWEVVPYSFVVDWFFNVGQALSAHSLALKSDAIAASAGYKISCKRSVVGGCASITFTTDFTGEVIFGGPRTAEGYGVYEVREPGSVSSLPQSNINLDAYKLADLAALVHQLFRGDTRALRF